MYKRVEVWMLETSEPVVHLNVKATYTKGPLYCVQCAPEIVGDKDMVYKYPVINMFRAIEGYGSHGGDAIKA